jgi:hypothetical protein
MRLCCVATQIIKYSAGSALRLDSTDYGQDDDDDDDELQSATGGDFGGGTPSTATRVFYSPRLPW